MAVLVADRRKLVAGRKLEMMAFFAAKATCSCMGTPDFSVSWKGTTRVL